MRLSAKRLGIAGAAVLCVVIVSTGYSQTLTTLVNFDRTNGQYPEFMALIQGTDGQLYGTTYFGGLQDDGTVFRMTPQGRLTTMYSFATTTVGEPYAGLVQGFDGNFYGTTTGYAENGNGTIFQITPDGVLTFLFTFGSGDGSMPQAPLLQGADGDFYGTTTRGGAHNGRGGTLFKVTSGGDLTTLHFFGGTLGTNPMGWVIQARNGDFYGTTHDGGLSGYGTVFRMTPQGAFTLLHSFDSSDGANPYDGLLQATDGSFYGTTHFGGANQNGTVFKITAQGQFSTLYNFCAQAGCADGANPVAGLIQATDGNLYGTTAYGGTDNLGTIFEITTGGALTTLHTFVQSDGAIPLGGLLQATDGNFYGSTVGGGSYDVQYGGYGTLFRFSLGLGAFVKVLPAAAKPGCVVKVLGTALSGATGVTFNGVPAAFTVEQSGATLSAVVPDGAADGKIEVTAPEGKLSSDIVFRVLP